jgi:hypothetical protein
MMQRVPSVWAAWIDVRGAWPILVLDSRRCFVLEGLNRSVTVEQALILLNDAGVIDDNNREK